MHDALETYGRINEAQGQRTATLKSVVRTSIRMACVSQGSHNLIVRCLLWMYWDVCVVNDPLATMQEQMGAHRQHSTGKTGKEGSEQG